MLVTPSTMLPHDVARPHVSHQPFCGTSCVLGAHIWARDVPARQDRCDTVQQMGHAQTFPLSSSPHTSQSTPCSIGRLLRGIPSNADERALSSSSSSSSISSSSSASQISYHKFSSLSTFDTMPTGAEIVVCGLFFPLRLICSRSGQSTRGPTEYGTGRRG